MQENYFVVSNLSCLNVAFKIRLEQIFTNLINSLKVSGAIPLTGSDDSDD